LEELTLTGIKPQEIAFGHLLGGVLPLSFPILILLPSIALYSIHLTLAQRMIPEISITGASLMALWFYPNVVTSLLSSAAIAQSVAFGRNSLVRPLLAWVAVSVLIVWPITLYVVLAWPYSFHVGAPALVAAKLLIAGAFLHHMAVRLNMRSHEEDGT
jgi:hypothetical protein